MLGLHNMHVFVSTLLDIRTFLRVVRQKPLVEYLTQTRYLLDPVTGPRLLTTLSLIKLPFQEALIRNLSDLEAQGAHRNSEYLLAAWFKLLGIQVCINT